MSDKNLMGPIIPDEVPVTIPEQIELAILIQKNFAENSLDLCHDANFTNERRDLGEAIESAQNGNNNLLSQILTSYINA